MKLKKLHIIGSFLAAGIAITTLSSNSGGIMGRSTAGCGGSGCHSASASNNTVIALNGLPAGGWTPSTTYLLTLTVSNSSSTAKKAGFDLTVNVGTLAAVSTGTMAMGTELHHTTPQNLASGTATWTFNWTAPASRTTALAMKIAGNAVNGDGQATTADVWNTASINSAAATTSIASVSEGGFSVYPNPAKDQLTVTAKSGKDVKIAAFAINGSHVAVGTEKVAADKYQVNISSLATGAYILVLSSEGKTYATRFVKQ